MKHAHAQKNKEGGNDGIVLGEGHSEECGYIKVFAVGNASV